MTEGQVPFTVAERVKEARQIVENNISAGLVLAARDVEKLLAEAEALLSGLLENEADGNWSKP